MILSFFESIKYVGHLFPVAFVRIYLGYYYFHLALIKFKGDFLFRPQLADQISEWLPQSMAPHWYKVFLTQDLISHWKTLSFIIVGLEFAIGVSYLIGYVVRPMALLAFLLSLNYIFISPFHMSDQFKLLMTTHILIAWIGAGRCIGMDYYFYKRHRGIWW